MSEPIVKVTNIPNGDFEAHWESESIRPIGSPKSFHLCDLIDEEQMVGLGRWKVTVEFWPEEKRAIAGAEESES